MCVSGDFWLLDYRDPISIFVELWFNHFNTMTLMRVTVRKQFHTLIYTEAMQIFTMLQQKNIHKIYHCIHL